MNEMNLHYEYMKDSPLVFFRPAGSPTAPIVSGELTGQHVSDPIEIEVPLDLSNTNATLEFWAKPDTLGPIAQFAGHEVVYTGGTYRVSNENEEYAEIPVASNAARHLSITVMNTSIILSVDGEFDEVGKEFYTPAADEKAIIFPFGGGLIDYVALYDHQVDKNRLRNHFRKGRELPEFAYDSLSKMSDDERTNVTVENFLPEPLAVAGEFLTELSIPHDPTATSFKFEWKQTGNVFVAFDNEWRPSGYSTNVFPEEITVDIFEGTLHNFDLTTYRDNTIGSADQEADLTTPYSTATGETHPLLHSDLGGALGGVEITPRSSNEDGRSWEQATPPSGDIYRWTGAPHNSPSEKIIDGVTVASNLALNPRASNETVGWQPNNSADNTSESNVPVPASHPLGIETAAMSTRVSAEPSISLFSDYDIDGLSIATRGAISVWVYTERDASALLTGGLETPVLANTWTLVESSGTTDEHLNLFITVPTEENVEVGERAWATGVIVQPVGSEPTEYFDGDFDDELENDLWVDTDNNTVYTWNDGEWVEADEEGILDGGLIGTVSFWTNRKNGEITPGVTVTEGVVSGAQYLNGAPATSEPMNGWYMVTLTGMWAAPVVLNGPISNITLDKTQLSASEVNRLYRSFFGFDSVVLDSNTLSVTDSTPFSITKSWAIVSSG